jgi:hypothetical protein
MALIVQIKIKSKNCCNACLRIIITALVTMYIGKVYSIFYDGLGCTVLSLLLVTVNRETENIGFFSGVVKRLKISRAFLSHVYFIPGNINNHGPGSSVGIATGYGLDGPGIES